MSTLFQQLLTSSFTRVLPMLGVSNFFFYACYRYTNVITFIDVGWVFNHVLAGFYHFYVNKAHTSLEGTLYLGLLLLWGARLGSHLFQRCLIGHSDPRYDEIPNRLNLRKSFFTLMQFELQAFMTVFTTIPLFFVFRNLSVANSLSLFVSDWKNICGVTLVGAGIIGEAIADYQLEKFKKSPKKTEGKDKPICQDGVWKYARHPNLFFEMCAWCGFGVLGIRKLEPYTFLALAGPSFLYLIVNFLSTRITDKHMSKSRSNWEEHKAKTNKYFPFFKI